MSANERNINELPDELLEFILGHMPPYADLQNCALVCKRWTDIVRNVRRHTALNFHKGLTDFRLCWKAAISEERPTIAGRFSHSAIVYKNSMFVFGGGSSTQTTFNDLWRYDLSSRQWVRPTSTGTYPSPKACSTLVRYKDFLILMGGWRHPSTFPPYQLWRLFDELHAYNVTENRWTALNATHNGPPPVTGHSATVHGDCMIVFGGYTQEEHVGTRLNDVYSLDLTTMEWSKKETNERKPAPRYGQFQIALSESHCLVMGGCGGPNNMFNDAWLLDMTQEPWQWTSIPVRNKKWGATHMWCNPACKVGSKLVVLGPVATALSDFQMIRHQVLPPNPNNAMRMNENLPLAAAAVQPNPINNRRPAQPAANRLSPNEPNNIQPNAREPNRSRPNASPPHQPQPSSSQSPASSSQPQPSSSQQSNPPSSPSSSGGASGGRGSSASDSQPGRSNSNDDDAQNRLQRNLQMRSRRSDTDDFNLPKRFGDSTTAPNNLPMAAFNVSQDVPSTSATSPRERRLQLLRRMEEKYQVVRPVNVNNDPMVEDQPAPQKRIKRNCIGLFVCDISNILRPDDPYIEWVEHKNSGHIPNAPERLILSTLVAGNGELIMFGGMRKESLSKEFTDKAMLVSSSMHFLQAPKDVI